jgi:toxin-antitoxin system PIN domain toxin
VIIPDANLLIYAYDASRPNHARARQWWEDALSGDEVVAIPWIVILAFVRLTTHPTLNANPMSITQSRAAVDAWLELDHVRLLAPTNATFNRFFDLLIASGTAGNLSTDALIAALAIEYGGHVYSNDFDFGRFSGLVWSNPLESLS